LSRDAAGITTRTPRTGCRAKSGRLLSETLNADDRWERNDLNDLLYLCCAAAYADIVVGEKKTCNYLQRVQSNVTPGAQVFAGLADALPSIEAAVSAYGR
jgi:hypothetical protein